MGNSADEIMRRKIWVVRAGIVLFIMIVIAVWVFTSIPKHTANVNTVNADKVVEKSELSEEDIAKLETSFRNYLKIYYSDKDEMKGRMTITVRPESIKITDGEMAEFLIDAEELRLTYRGKMDLKNESALFRCAELAEVKYKGGFCVGTEGQSTISQVFGVTLPIEGGYVEQMGMGLEERAIDTKKASYKMGWEMRVNSMELGEDENPDGSVRPYFIITAATCGEDEKYIEAAKDYVDMFIEEMQREKKDGGYDGITSEIFNYKVECKNE